MERIEKKLIEWFNKTGYPFELWTESTLSNYNFSTSNSSLYKDQESKKFREIDLIANRGWESKDGETYFALNLIIECKKSDKPFVLLSNNKQKGNKFDCTYYYGIDEPITRMLINNESVKIELPGKSCNGFKLTQGFVKGDETCHQAINTLIKSFNDHLENEKESLEYFIENNHHSITLPILLLDAPLFELKIDDKNELKIKEIDSGIISNITHLNKFYPSSFPIPIITKKSFEIFLKLLDSFGEENIRHLTKNPLCNIKNLNKTKIVIRDKNP